MHCWEANKSLKLSCDLRAPENGYPHICSRRFCLVIFSRADVVNVFVFPVTQQVEALKSAYRHVDDGGVSKKPVPGAIVEPTSLCTIADQLARAGFSTILAASHTRSPPGTWQFLNTSVVSGWCFCSASSLSTLELLSAFLFQFSCERSGRWLWRGWSATTRRGSKGSSRSSCTRIPICELRFHCSTSVYLQCVSIPRSDVIDILPFFFLDLKKNIMSFNSYIWYQSWTCPLDGRRGFKDVLWSELPVFCERSRRRVTVRELGGIASFNSISSGWFVVKALGRAVVIYFFD